MKAYRGIDGRIRVFRPDMNMERMNRSAVRAGLPPFNGQELIKCLSRLVSIDQEWVPHSESSSLYIRPTFIGIDVSSMKVFRVELALKAHRLLHPFLPILFSSLPLSFPLSCLCGEQKREKPKSCGRHPMNIQKERVG